MNLRSWFTRGKKTPPRRPSPKATKPSPKASKPVTKAPSNTAKNAKPDSNVVTEKFVKGETAKIHQRFDAIETKCTKMEKTMKSILVLVKKPAAAVESIPEACAAAPTRSTRLRSTRSKSTCQQEKKKFSKKSPSKVYDLRKRRQSSYV